MNSVTASIPQAETVPVNRLRWWNHLLLIAPYPLIIGLFAWQMGKVKGPALSSGARGLLMVSGVELAIFGCIFGFGWLTSRASRDDLLLRWRPGWSAIPLGIAYSVALRVVVAIVFAVLAGLLVVLGIVTPAGLSEFASANRPDIEAIVDVGAMRKNPLYFWLTITLVSFVVAGLREELWRAGVLAGLRALWPRWFGSRTGQFWAVAVAATIFGVGHVLQGTLAVFATAIVGLLLGVIMVFHRSIWPAVIAHGMFDASTFVLIMFLGEKLQELQKTTGH